VPMDLFVQDGVFSQNLERAYPVVSIDRDRWCQTWDKFFCFSTLTRSIFGVTTSFVVF